MLLLTNRHQREIRGRRKGCRAKISADSHAIRLCNARPAGSADPSTHISAIVHSCPHLSYLNYICNAHRSPADTPSRMCLCAYLPTRVHFARLVGKRSTIRLSNAPVRAVERNVVAPSGFADELRNIDCPNHVEQERYLCESQCRVKIAMQMKLVLCVLERKGDGNDKAMQW